MTFMLWLHQQTLVGKGPQGHFSALQIFWREVFRFQSFKRKERVVNIINNT